MKRINDVKHPEGLNTHTHTHTHTHTCILNKQGFKTEKLYILLKNIRIGY